MRSSPALVWARLVLGAVLGQATVMHVPVFRSPLALASAPAPSPTARPTGPSTDDVLRLRSALTDRRDPWVRPDLATPTVVDVTLGVKHIILQEMQSTMSVSAWVKMTWTDPRISWQDMSDEAFKGIKVLHLNVEHIWHPDIVLKNGLAGKGASLLDGAAASVRPDGRVSWTPAVLLETFCELDLRRWPFERHVCAVHLGSWTLDNTQLKIGSINNTIEFPGQSGEFVLDEVVEKWAATVEPDTEFPFDSVVFTIAVHREPGTYRAVIYTPAAVVVILCLATFLLPPRAGEKIILGGVNAMLICLFLIYFAHSLPVLTNQTPFIVVFYAASLYLVCLSLVVAVFVLNISRQKHAVGLPWPIKNALAGPCGRFLFLDSYVEQIMGVDHGPCSGRGQEELPVVMHEESVSGSASGEATASRVSARAEAEIGSRSVSPDLDWLLLAAAVDRSLFVVYSLLFLGLAIVYHV